MHFYDVCFFTCTPMTVQYVLYQLIYSIKGVQLRFDDLLLRNAQLSWNINIQTNGGKSSTSFRS